MLAMDPTAANLTALSAFLAQTLDPVARKAAEASLSQAEAQPGFGPCLLAIVGGGGDGISQLGAPVRQAAAVKFKNYVKKYWKQDDSVPDRVSAADRVAIKSNVVRLMIVVSTPLQLQLSEAISLIADTDFPKNWDTLIDDLVGKLSLTDWSANAGILQTAHSIFRRWRAQVRSNDLFSEIKFVLERFSTPYLQFFQHTDNLITQNSTDVPMLARLFETLLLLVKIFYDLNFQDLPEFFEDHMTEFMELLLKYLQYTNNGLERTTSRTTTAVQAGNPLAPHAPAPGQPAQEDEDDEDTEEGPITKVKAMICEIADLYARRYEEEFGKHLERFVGAVWTLLTTTGREMRFDGLVSKAIAFLTSVAKPARHRHFFSAPNVLSQICEQVVIPNMQMRKSDLEEFEDDPIGWVRRDIEGGDAETRRRAASDMVRGLMENFNKEVTEIFSGYVGAYLQNYETNRAANWRSKDTALYLIISLSAMSTTAQLGATKINEHIPFLSVLLSNVLPDLQADVKSGGVHPVIKVDCLKYLIMFRSHLTKQQLVEVLPSVLSHFEHPNPVVATYAAIALEKILAIKAPQTGALMFVAADLEPVGQTVIDRMLSLVEKGGPSPEKLAENDYVMKAIMRVVIVVRSRALPYITDLIRRLSSIIAQISKNPSNPRFNHFAFETLGALVRYVVHEQRDTLAGFEQMLFPVFEGILATDVQEFMPYVFQIMSQLLEFHSEAQIPERYESILHPLLQPALWESQGNVPALVRLLQAFLAKGAAQIVAKQQIQAFLGVYQKLIGSKLNDQYGFDLLTEVFWNIPTASLQPFIRNIFFFQLTRLSSSKTSKFQHAFVLFLNTLLAMLKDGFGPNELITAFDTLQPNLFHTLLNQVVLPELSSGEVLRPDERQLIVVGMTNLLTRSPRMKTEPFVSNWPGVISEIVRILQIPVASGAGANADVDDELQLLEIEETGYQASYSRLATVGKLKRDPLAAAGITDVSVYFATQLRKLAAEDRTLFLGAVSKLPKDVSDNVQNALSSVV
ncbi:Cse1-domain-containing protein [Gonapodya prolifera JEL478]|uniref:Cse1-domain-containing protein n=1 Tax=Gonapodya prolifera (strain JEL478) TaxID=1344416 RepID=A0A139AQ13_GONPJ|nr:Cse1-domain-containing protein [Gonapodya prolifera JEL478]|eukprot:KXS18851.1 Cse1-domain-containing protein [Gonapodya prolifera JEL478]